MLDKFSNPVFSEMKSVGRRICLTLFMSLYDHGVKNMCFNIRSSPKRIHALW